jgi:hypothetical protein
MTTKKRTVDLQREIVEHTYQAAKKKNEKEFLEGNAQATKEYIFQNQKEDAFQIVNLFRNGKHIVSVNKKTKVGMDGLMIEVCHQLCTDIDDNFVVDPANVRIITAMSNIKWQQTLREKAPKCFEKQIFHHGQLSKCSFKNLKNALIIIDEIDCGDKEEQVLHTLLKDAGILNAKNIVKNNLKIMVASATLLKQQYELAQWGNLHQNFTMTIPKEYIDHKSFLDKGILQQFYQVTSLESAHRWIKEDCIDAYAEQCMCGCNHRYRIHIIRVQAKYVHHVREACEELDVKFYNHTSEDRIPFETLRKLFEEQLKSHVVLAIKGFYRRADFIPNAWKMKIGATHEQCTKQVNDSVQIQGLPGRMTGYWRENIDAGHVTGPYRTCLESIERYEENFRDPFGDKPYKTSDFKKMEGGVITKLNPSFLNAKNIEELKEEKLPGELIVKPSEDLRIRVPVILDVSEEEMKELTGRKKKNEMLQTILQRANLSEYRCTYSVAPGRHGKNAAYQKTCGSARDAAKNGHRFFWKEKSDGPYENEKICHAYIDKYENKVCVCLRDIEEYQNEDCKEEQKEAPKRKEKKIKCTKALEQEFCKELLEVYQTSLKGAHKICVKKTNITFDKIWSQLDKVDKKTSSLIRKESLFEKYGKGEQIARVNNEMQMHCYHLMKDILGTRSEKEQESLKWLLAKQGLEL